MNDERFSAYRRQVARAIADNLFGENRACMCCTKMFPPNKVVGGPRPGTYLCDGCLFKRNWWKR